MFTGKTFVLMMSGDEKLKAGTDGWKTGIYGTRNQLRLNIWQAMPEFHSKQTKIEEEFSALNSTRLRCDFSTPSLCFIFFSHTHFSENKMRRA